MEQHRFYFLRIVWNEKLNPTYSNWIIENTTTMSSHLEDGCILVTLDSTCAIGLLMLYICANGYRSLFNLSILTISGPGKFPCVDQKCFQWYPIEKTLLS